MEDNVDNGELTRILATLQAKYRTETVNVKIGSDLLRILQLADFEDYVGKLAQKEYLTLEDLPLWAKVWEASFVMASYWAHQPVVPGRRILEIGTGIGVLGVFMASKGHRVTLSDINEDALLFARANVLLNGCEGNADVQRIDWNDTFLGEPYHVIVGSEVVYDRATYPALVRFLDQALVPGGTIFLAKNTQLQAPGFFAELVTRFAYKEKIIPFEGHDEISGVALYAIRRRGETTCS
ncbi:class I SAM-dependent methyltransferase [Desulfosoma caldarium]|uniref:class I SAM-dependent methyltransferase n=1 Tax=Desulfosoma caldarium TaxID=610254 RepID=UPI000F476A6C|nr:methyltransferase [Desulfosoma caldarium]